MVGVHIDGAEPVGGGAHGGDVARVVGLARVTAALASAAGEDDVGSIITERATAVLGADSAMLAVRVGADQLRVVAQQGLTEAQRRALAVVEVAGPGPFSEAVRTAAPVTVHGRADVAARYPQYDDGSEYFSVVLPLLTGGGQALGALGFRFDERVEPLGPAELSVLLVVADMCAQTLQRLTAQAHITEQAGRLRFLADASQVLASSLDYRETLTRVAALAVPTHADWCSVEIVEDGSLRTLAVAHTDPAKVALAHELQARWPADPNAPGGAAQVARSGQSLLIEEVTEEMLVAGTRDAEHLAVARALGLRSAISVPLVAHQQVLGVLTLVSAESGRRYADADMPFVEDLGRRAALAIDNADLYTPTRRVAAELQAHLLPSLPPLPGWRTAAVYRQSGRTEVGGDFYDVVPLPDGRLATVIGDVMGRGLDAAVAGSRMRAAARVLISQDPEPAAVSRAMDRVILAEALTPLATAAYLLFDPSSDSVALVVAGHPLPLRLPVGGHPGYLMDGRSPVHGVGAVTRRSALTRFVVGDGLLLYTDGLIERRDEEIDAGLARLRAAASSLLEGPHTAGVDPTGKQLTARLAALVDKIADTERHDDIATLLLQRTA